LRRICKIAIKFSSNTYNNVNVTIKTANEFTDRELRTAKFLDSLVNEKTIDNLLNSDYYSNFYNSITPIADNNQQRPTCKIFLKIVSENNINFMAVKEDQKLIR